MDNQHPHAHETQSDIDVRGGGLTIPRIFTQPGTSPFDTVEWEIRDARITGSGGETVFLQTEVEIPRTWSQTATNIVASKYFHGQHGSEQRERSVRQLLGRVVDTITAWGRKDGYFRTGDDADTFSDELAHLLLSQAASFNSPVWFNVGVERRPQCSACFINSVEDTMESILELAKTEGLLFKYGSGAGTNLSPLRSGHERLSSGGIASGPVSFMKGFDAFAGVIKSGGKTRRAAKMVILNMDHPDIREFISCKANEEKKAWVLIDAGYDGSFNGEAYSSIFFQNANNSVRTTDAFMEAVESDGTWFTRAILDQRVVHEFKARELMAEISEAAHLCGDPGIQFDSTINRWNPCKASGRINASNPCSEYMFLDDSACNLASLNLMKFVDESGRFDAFRFARAVDILFTAQEILVSNASYPTPRIERNSHEFRPIGLGYANLGALLMYLGLPYDSDEGRAMASTVTAIMTGEAYLQSARIASEMGPFSRYEENRDSFLDVMNLHRESLAHIPCAPGIEPLLAEARHIWDDVLATGAEHGFRNAQATVLAPTGTIGFMMDCDTTGVEPDLALVKFKQLVGGGSMQIVNRTIPSALERLGYTPQQMAAILAHLETTGTIEGAPEFQEEHLPVFDCALKPLNGSRSIHYMGHVKMMAAVQPFLSGAISKTVNMPNEATPAEVEHVYREAWKLGLKAIAIYRDGSKRTQPMSVGRQEEQTSPAALLPDNLPFRPVRRKLPDERASITHKFRIADHEGYITVGMYEDGTPGEIFLLISKEGSVISGLMDGFATAISMAFQYGVPLKVLVDKFTHTRFEPSGFTGNPHIPFAKSLLDYIFKWLALKFLTEEEQRAAGIIQPETPSLPVAHVAPSPSAHASASTEGHLYQMQADAPTCATCGTLMVRNGACYKCMNCGATSGCS